MAYNTKINLSDDKVFQSDGQLLTLSGDTVIAAVGSITYETQPTFTGDTQLVTKQYVDVAVIGGVTGGTIYNLASPSTVEVGGLPASSALLGLNSNEILEKILVKYLVPTFSSFSSPMNTPVEVGTTCSGSVEFSWGFTNPTNVSGGTMCIVDVTNSNTPIATSISTASPASANIGTKTFTSCGQTQSWKGSAKNTCGTQFSSGNHTITGLLPYFWGTCYAPGAAGAGRPSTLTPAEITGGTKVIAGSSGSFSITFNSTADDYMWFAVPASVGDKSAWYVDVNNFGTIGGAVSPAGQLFPSPVEVLNVQNNMWSGQAYNVYIANKQSASSVSMTIS